MDHKKDFSLKGNLIDIHKRQTYPAEIHISEGKIKSIRELDKPVDSFIAPGLVDAHVHIESSMLTPVEFARLAVPHGTVATVSDPHEIANVTGLEGVRYMIDNAAKSPLKFHFGAPSCVPATSFENAGAVLDAKKVEEMLDWKEISYLAEIMNFPGVLTGDPEVMAKIQAAVDRGMPVDGHAPGLRGDQAKKYADAGISTDHECTTYGEARDKIDCGMKIAIREGSAAKNFEELIPLLGEFPDRMMFCSDDKHPDELILSHIDQLVRRALEKGLDLYDILRAASLVPHQHYNLRSGILREGDPADFIVIDHPTTFKVQQTWIDGHLAAENGQSKFPSVSPRVINRFEAKPKSINAFQIPATSKKIRVIKAIDGALITESFEAEVKTENGLAVADTERDLLPLTVVNRYREADPAHAFIHGFGLKRGAIASTVAHDSHNIIAIGTQEDDLATVANELVKNHGGICAYDGEQLHCLPLPIAGLLSLEKAEVVAQKYKEIDRVVKEKMGSTLSAPFMTLSFMALLVIPSLKLSDLGLFDGEKFEFRDLFV